MNYSFNTLICFFLCFTSFNNQVFEKDIPYTNFENTLNACCAKHSNKVYYTDNETRFIAVICCNCKIAPKAI